MHAELRCPHLPACPGCPRFGAELPAPEVWRSLADFCTRHGARFAMRAGKRRHFRCRARLSVRGRQGAAKIGIFAEGTHRVVDIPRCEIHHPLINSVAAALKASMRELGTSSYSDVAHAGLVRALQVVVQRSTRTAQVVLVCNASEPTSATPLLERLAGRLGSQLHSLWWNGNPERTNTILGPHLEHVSGPKSVVEVLGGARVHYPPAAFGQNNLDLFEDMLEQIHALVPPGRDVVELYAGSGAIGLGLVARSRSVVFNELGAASLAGLALGLDGLPSGERERVRVIAGSAESAAAEIGPHRIVIVDPPRKGLEPELLAAFERGAPERLIYVSCGLASFLRDAEALTSRGLVLESATAYDLFPYTGHIETLASFRTSETRSPHGSVPGHEGFREDHASSGLPGRTDSADPSNRDIGPS
jgi:23S rRNA (uracil1939-C5)-methyltransferase